MDTNETDRGSVLHQTHQALFKNLEELDETAARSGTDRSEDLRKKLAATQTLLAEHFGLEEQNGYMDALEVREPRLDRALRELVHEHRQLTTSLDALIEEAGGSTTLNEALLDRVQAWIAGVRRHEHRENELVQDAFNLDLGSGD